MVLVAVDGGGFSLASRTTLALGVWWIVLVGVALELWPVGEIGTPAVVTGGMLAAFAAWTGASLAWADDREAAFLEFDRVLLYLGIFVLVVLTSRRDLVRFWSDGLALGLVGVAAVALVSRFFPDRLDGGTLPELIPEAGARLSYPVGYWNGVAILVALAVPLLLGAAVRARSFAIRAAAVAPVPAIAAVAYLASSRGGVLVAVAGSLVFLVLVRRWSAAGAIAAAGLGSALAVVWVLQRRPELVEEPLGEVGRGQAPGAAVLLAALCVATGLLYAGLRAVPIGSRPPAALGWGAAALAAAAAVLALVSLDPAARFEEFKRPPDDSPVTVRGHFASGGGSGRWQQWSAAVEQFRAYPLQGGGAGSHAAWRLEHAPADEFTTEAHSLFLETLGELGVVGLCLLGLALLTAIGTAAVRTSREPGSRRVEGAAIVAVLCAYVVGAGIDWMWELTVVSLVAVICLGLAVAEPEPRARQRPGGGPLALRLAAVAVGVTALGAQAVALLADERMQASRDAAAHGDLVRAAEAALQARAIMPWAASPPLQLALIHDDAGRPRAARRWVGEALVRNPQDWRAWLVAARIQTRAGNIRAARRSLVNARRLNPGSPAVDND